MIDVLKRKEVNQESIHHAVSSMIQTSLRGVDSHGINLFPHYCNAIQSGRINNEPNFEINQTSASTAILDADHAFGHHAGSEAVKLAMQMAKESGMGAVSVKNSTHFGAAAYFALQAAEQGFAGFSFTNADALVKAHASKEAFFGTNPICFAAPLKNEGPFCLDMATSQVSWNKIKNYERENMTLPSGWAYDINGQMVVDPAIARSLEPSGNYKGFGLGMVVDILCSILSGGAISKDLMPMYTSPIEAQRKIGHFFMVLNIEKFINLDVFKEQLQSMVDRIRELPQLEGGDEVMVAGDPEKKCFTQRINEGIPMDETKYGEYVSISEEIKKAVI